MTCNERWFAGRFRTKIFGQVRQKQPLIITGNAWVEKNLKKIKIMWKKKLDSQTYRAVSNEDWYNVWLKTIPQHCSISQKEQCIWCWILHDHPVLFERDGGRGDKLIFLICSAHRLLNLTLSHPDGSTDQHLTAHAFVAKGCTYANVVCVDNT